MTDNEKEDLEFTISDLESENDNLLKQFKEVKNIFDKIEKRKLSIVYVFPNWEIKDELGVLAVDKILMGALKKL